MEMGGGNEPGVCGVKRIDAQTVPEASGGEREEPRLTALSFLPHRLKNQNLGTGAAPLSHSDPK